MISDFGNFDYIIVGAGSAGCVLANRLSKDNKVNVLLLEAGGNDWNPWIHIPAGYFRTLHNPATDWCYKTTPEPALNGRSIEWPRGKVLGGSIAGAHVAFEEGRGCMLQKGAFRAFRAGL